MKHKLLSGAIALLSAAVASSGLADSCWTVTIANHAGKISYDGWTLAFSGENNGGIIINSGNDNTLAGDGGVLDLSLPMRDGNGNEYYVRAIGQKAFRQAENPFLVVSKIKEVRLGGSVANIDAYAFSGCTNLTNVVPFIPDSVTVLGKNAFYNCPISCKLTVRSVKKIPEAAFYATAFGEAELPGVTNIDYRAFYGNGAISNVVFGAERVGFASSAVANGYGNACFCHATETARFYFPGKAPYLPQNDADGSGQGHTGTLNLFGQRVRDRTIYGSWKVDPDGWNEILSQVGKPKTEIPGTFPGQDESVRRVMGKLFYWQEKSAGTSNSAWLIDWRSPLDPQTGMAIIFR